MNSALFQSRLAKLSSELSNQNLDCLLLSSPQTMGYAHGLFEDGHERLLTLAIRASGEVCLLGPALSETSAKECGIGTIKTYTDGQSPMDLFADFADDWDLRTSVIAVDPVLRADLLLGMQHVLPAALFRSADSVLGKVMGQKDEAEIEALRASGEIVDTIYRELLTWLKPGQTENEIAGRIRSMMLERGGNPLFCIVGGGPGSAEPHHANCDRPVEHGEALLLDFGCVYKGYCSDITRVIHFGPAPQRVRDVYSAVFQAHHAGVNAIRPGIETGEVDLVARNVLESHGYGEFFVHRLGHGIGMSVHELPNLSPGNETIMEPGHCFSIEPGVYLPGEFGIRLENIYACGSDGVIHINEEFEDQILEL